MRDTLRYIFGGAALGAVIGALGGWYVGRQRAGGQEAGAPRGSGRMKLDRDRMLRLVWSVIGIIRQIVSLD